MELCRTCLACSDLNPIFYPGSEDRLSKELELATGIIIKPDDGFPQKICDDCIFSLNEAIRFRNCSLKAHKALLEQEAQKMNLKLNEIEFIDDQENYIDKFGEDYEFIDEQENIDDNFGERIEFLDDWEYYGDQDEDHVNGYDSKVEEDKIEKIKPEVKNKVVATKLKCEYCQREFKSRIAYSDHVSKHEMFVICEECGMKCAKNRFLNHKRAKHNLEKIHKCQHCDYEASFKEALTVHLRKHTGEKPFVCDTCGLAFNRRSTLITHVAIHLTEKNFKCPICPKMFASKKFLIIHKSKHREKRYFYKCIECPNTFQTTNAARRHMFRQHGIPNQQQGKLGRILRNEL